MVVWRGGGEERGVERRGWAVEGTEGMEGGGEGGWSVWDGVDGVDGSGWWRGGGWRVEVGGLGGGE